MYGNPISKYSNPYTDFLSDGRFVHFGREGILQEIAQVISVPNPDHRDLHGLSGMGKTSLLRYVAGNHFVNDYRDFLSGEFYERPDKLFFLYLSGWIDSIHPFVLMVRALNSRWREYYEAAPEKPHVDAALLAPVVIGNDEGGRAFDILETTIRRLSLAGIRPVLLFDNFDTELGFGKLNVDEVGRLGSVRDYGSLIFATERLLEEVNPAAKGSPLFKQLTQMPFRNMHDDQAELFLRAPLELAQVALPPADITHLIELARGFPYLLVLGGRALWALRRRLGLHDKPDEQLSEPMLLYLDERLRQEFWRPFEHSFQNLNPRQQEVLIDLARRETISLDSLREAGKQSSRLLWLEQYGLIDVLPDGRLRLFSTLFQQFVLDQAVAPATDAGPALSSADLTVQQETLYNVFRNRPDEVVTFEELGQELWGWPANRRAKDLQKGDLDKIRIAVSKLRRELAKSQTGENIVSLRSRGYRFEPARG